MPVEINITDENITYAEQCLIGGRNFDFERREFIRNLETIDLQAVPGSGKTTALLAKLVILEKKLPFPDGSGILVLSHTNAAVDEIKKEIQKYCPKLFSYPNFVGTIQSFVDEFLAKPYYTIYYGNKPYRIDNEIYLEKLDFKLKLCLSGQIRNTFKMVSHIKIANYQLLQNYRFGVDEGQNIILLDKINGNELVISKPRGNTRKENYNDYSEGEKSAIKSYLVRLKTELIEGGNLCFDDAYFLANRYLYRFPKIKDLLQKRFQFVFVDEMQDMEKHQYQLLEDLFYNNGNSISKYQRIGDKNQAIYDGKADVQDFWEERFTTEITGSIRLSPPIANVVKNFALHPIEIVGLGENEDGSKIDIPTYILIYDDDSRVRVITKFAQIIKELKDEGKLPSKSNNKYYAVAWNSVWKNQEDIDNTDKIRLADYYPDYSREEDKSFIDYSTLESYLNFYDKNNQTLYSIRRNILNAFLRVLRLEKLRDTQNRSREFSKRRLIRHFRYSTNEGEYNQFRLNVFKWSFAVVKGETDSVISEIKDYIPSFLANFKRTLSDLVIDEELKAGFINSPCPSKTTNDQPINALYKRNVVNFYDDIEIQVGTVHSVKGQTHTATLYLESAYKIGYGRYESERLRNQFKGESLESTLSSLRSSKDLVKKSTKMAYVGFSRPTHLLCIGIHKSRFDVFLKDMAKELWKIVQVD